MKKIALTSLFAVFAVSGAHAANIINGNPLYMPGENRFYSVTDLNSHSTNGSLWNLNEEFGYGVTRDLTVLLSTDFSQDHGFDEMNWDEFDLAMQYRFLRSGNWVADFTGVYGVGNVWLDHQPMLDKDLTKYAWMAGVRGGYMASDWTVAGHVNFGYTNSESFNWDEEGIHFITVGLDGQYLLDSHWGLNAGVEYMGVLDNTYNGFDVKNEGSWNGTFGVNYNIDATKFVGAYIRGDLGHKVNADTDETENGWEVKDGFGFGAKFGIDF